MTVTRKDIAMRHDEDDGRAGRTWRSELTWQELDKLYHEGLEVAVAMEKDIKKNQARVRQEKLVLGSNPPPKTGRARPSWDLVIEDMKARDKTGFKKYGVRLQADNGRNHLQDAYEEALDLAVYLRTQIEKEKLDGK